MAFDQEWHDVWAEKSWRFHESLRRLKETGDVRSLVEALEHIYTAIERIVEKLGTVEERLNELRIVEARLTKLEHAVENLAESLAALKEGQEHFRKALARIDMNIGGLTEAALTRFFVESLERAGARVVSVERNMRVNSMDIDLLVTVERDKERAVYIVEVKVKPGFDDVGRLLVLADLYEARYGIRPRPVLAGVWIGSEIEAYASKKGVTVFRV